VLSFVNFIGNGDLIVDLRAGESCAELVQKTLKNGDSVSIEVLTSKTGLRHGEVRGLQVDDLEDGFLFIRHAQSDEMDLKDTKNGKTKRVPVSEELLQALRNLVTTNLSPVDLG